MIVNCRDCNKEIEIEGELEKEEEILCVSCDEANPENPDNIYGMIRNKQIERPGENNE